MTPLLVKTLIGVGASAAVVGSGGYGIYRFVTGPKTIKEKLVREGLEPLDLSESTNSSEEWTKKITEYKKSTSTYPKFTDLNFATNSSEDADKIKKLKEKCRAVLDTLLSFSDVKDLETKAKLWCFRNDFETT